MPRTDAEITTDPVSTEQPAASTEEALPRQRIIAALFTFLSFALVCVVIATFAVGYRPLKLRTAEMKKRPVTVAFYWPPMATPPAKPGVPPAPPQTWVNAEIRAELEKLVKNILADDPFDTRSLAAARDALFGTGWFNADLTLSRDPHNAVEIRGTWRIPVAAVRTQGPDGGVVDQLVSAKGELLPPRYKPDGSGLKVIVGVKHEPPKLGEPWLGGDVQAGLRLLEYLAVLPRFDQVAGVDVSEYSPDRKLVVVTDLGNRIHWGGPPDEFSPGQATPQTKLGRLAQLGREHGRIDAGRVALDIRLTDGVYIIDTLGLAAAPVEEPPARKSKPTRTASRNARH